MDSSLYMSLMYRATLVSRWTDIALNDHIGTPWTNSVTQGTVNNAHTSAETEWSCICCLNYDVNIHTLVKVKLQ